MFGRLRAVVNPLSARRAKRLRDLDAASFDGPGAIVTLDLPSAECHDMRWSGVAHQPSVQGGQDNQLTVYGDLVLSPAMSWGATGDILLTGSGDKSIDGQGVALGAYAMRLDELGATWTLKSPLVLQNGYLFVERGVLTLRVSPSQCAGLSRITAT